MALLIDVQNAIDSSEFPDTATFEQWVATTLRFAGFKQPSAEMTMRIVSSDESQQLNSQYRGKNQPTNVLSFPFEAPPQVPCDLLGDLVICHAVVVHEAKAQDKTLLQHYAHMVVHGTLHLLGFDHLEDDEAQEMEALETRILADLGFSDPYLDN